MLSQTAQIAQSSCPKSTQNQCIEIKNLEITPVNVACKPLYIRRNQMKKKYIFVNYF